MPYCYLFIGILTLVSFYIVTAINVSKYHYVKFGRESHVMGANQVVDKPADFPDASFSFLLSPFVSFPSLSLLYLIVTAWRMKFAFAVLLRCIFGQKGS